MPTGVGSTGVRKPFAAHNKWQPGLAAHFINSTPFHRLVTSLVATSSTKFQSRPPYDKCQPLSTVGNGPTTTEYSGRRQRWVFGWAPLQKAMHRIFATNTRHISEDSPQGNVTSWTEELCQSPVICSTDAYQT
ncbi:unnamed protein product [Caenorhabditis auriculariae]|uniref:Uncharacterized protein n=1 Tax=Caenorhabditis auriculariae TaxID=2777116 RepID=A0A8S1GYA4_9PELO|nr:unnamed protein product [Caenorhabditis auriculariae]